MGTWNPIGCRAVSHCSQWLPTQAFLPDYDQADFPNRAVRAPTLGKTEQSGVLSPNIPSGSLISDGVQDKESQVLKFLPVPLHFQPLKVVHVM